MVKKLNFSSKRIAVYNALKSSRLHPSPRMIYENIKPDYPDISLGTVYRNLNLFKEQGLANTVAVVNGEERLDGDTTPHAHFICNCCGGVYDIYNEDLTAISTGLEKDGFVSESVSLSFYGKCSKCS